MILKTHLRSFRAVSSPVMWKRSSITSCLIQRVDKMPSVRVSSGRLTALWVILRAANQLGGQAFISDIRRVAGRTSLRSGGLPIGDGERLAFEGGFLTQVQQQAHLTPLGWQALRIGSG